MSRGPRAKKHKKDFIHKEEVDTILSLYSLGTDVKSIAKMTHISERKVIEKIKEAQKGMVNKFTVEEDLILLHKLKEGINTPKALEKFITKKSWWMIRNRLRLFHTKIHSIETATDEDIIAIFHKDEYRTPVDENSSFINLFEDSELSFDDFSTFQNYEVSNYDFVFD